MIVIAVILTLCVVAPISWFLAVANRKKTYEAKIGTAEEKAREIIDEALKTAETKKREALLEAKEESLKTKNELDKETKERRAELQRYERRVLSKEENLDKKAENMERREAGLASREEALNKRNSEVEALYEKGIQELERISGLTSEQAKEYLLRSVEAEVKHDTAKMIKDLENKAKEEADMVISMDADLQDDIDAIDAMVDKYNEGYDVVYGVRNKRETDTFFKRFTAQAYYKLLLKLGVDIVYNHADFRLMSKRVLDNLENYKEVNLFLRGIVPMIGFPSTNVYYERHERYAGESKYPLKKMLHFAFDGVTSLSIKPIRLITTLGIFIFLLSIGILIYSIIRHFLGYTALGWSSIMVSVWALGGLQIFSIGIIGEYIGKIYLESKHRPRFIVKEYLND